VSRLVTAPIALRDPAGTTSLDAPKPLAIGGRRITTAAAVVGILAFAGISVLLAATSDHVERPSATALYYGYLVAVSMLAGLCWRVRRPSSSFGHLLMAFGLAVWVVSWQSSDWPLLFDIGVLADGAGFLLTYWLFLAFPSGRLRTTSNRLLVGGLALTVAGFFLPWALLAPVIAGGGPLASCVPACPANVLQIGTDLDAVAFLGRWETYLMLAMTLVVLGVYWRRTMRASRPMRRSLLAVAATSLLFLPVFFTYHFSRQILEADPATVEVMGWALVGMRVLLPLGFLVALFQAELFAGAARGRLLEQLLRRPSPQRWREAVATAVDDPGAELAYWDPETARYRRPDGDELARPEAGSGRTWVTADRDGRPVAALVLDNTLAEDPELVRAATSATVLAVEQGALEGELRSSRARIVEAGDVERRRIERDIHDSAQQRLVALRIHLELAGASMEEREQRAMVERLGHEVDEAIDDLRTVASGVYPAVLTDGGVVPALSSMARHAALPVAVLDRGIGRHAPHVESTVYFCCLEAVQNAAKHAGPEASVTVRLEKAGGHVAFRVEDDGRGFDRDAAPDGHGLANIADRVATAGGTLEIDTAEDAGTRITGRIPVSGAA
jgi:signal transduction histidine kinase